MCALSQEAYELQGGSPLGQQAYATTLPILPEQIGDAVVMDLLRDDMKAGASISSAYLRVPGREELPVAEMRTQEKDAPALHPALFHPMEPLDLLDPAQGLPGVPLQDHELRYGPGQMPVKLPPDAGPPRTIPVGVYEAQVGVYSSPTRGDDIERGLEESGRRPRPPSGSGQSLKTPQYPGCSGQTLPSSTERYIASRESAHSAAE